MTDHKTLFISVFHNFIAKNILNTEAFKILKVKENLEIVLLAPEVKEQFFKDLYKSGKVEVRGVPLQKITNEKSAKLFSAWSHIFIKALYPRYKRVERLKARRTPWAYIKYCLENILAFLMESNKPARYLFRKLFLSKKAPPEVAGFFDEFHPDVFFSTDIFDEGDCLFAAEAKKRKVKLIGMIRSWDNCHSKGLMRVIPDQLLVNNFTLKDEAIRFHDVPEKIIEVVGSPQNDLFITRERAPKEEFFHSMGLDPAKKLVLFSPAGAILSNTDHHLVEIFKKALENGEFDFPVQFLIRNHPNHPANLSRFVDTPGMVIEDPGKVFNPKNPKDTELTGNDNEHLADELFYADVVVWVATTLGVDAIVFDKPQIAVDFDGFEEKTYYESVRRYHDEDHMKKMLDMGGVAIAKNPEELVGMINRYLENPALDKEGREKVRQQQFYKLDGQAGSRVGKAVLDFISS